MDVPIVSPFFATDSFRQNVKWDDKSFRLQENNDATTSEEHWYHRHSGCHILLCKYANSQAPISSIYRFRLQIFLSFSIHPSNHSFDNSISLQTLSSEYMRSSLNGCFLIRMHYSFVPVSLSVSFSIVRSLPCNLALSFAISHLFIVVKFFLLSFFEDMPIDGSPFFVAL